MTEVLAKVIERDPDFSRLPAATPASLRRLVTRCLVKDPKQRLRDVGEARVALDEAERELAQGPASGIDAVAPAQEVVPPRWRTVLPWVLAAGLLVALVLVVTRGQGVPATPASITRLQITLPAGIELYSVVGAAVSCVFAPDGRHFGL